MLPTKSALQVEGNLPGEKTMMGFDADSVGHLMSVLTDLYSDKVMAVVREYSTNAFDSHRLAGITRPIEVTTPSPLSPMFRVKDYGVGLSLDEIKGIYSMYGASTKRESNDFTGMLGLGSKSALTFTTQFILTSVKNGMKCVVSVSREADGAGAMTVVTHEATNEDSGVEVSVPAAYTPGCKFLNAARTFFSYWKKGTYLLNGSEVESATDGMEEILPGVFVESRGPMYRRDGLDIIVMGNVAYPVKFPGTTPPWYMVAHVDIGSVDFTPSREALHYTPRTLATIEELFAKVSDGLAEKIQEKIRNSESYTKAMINFRALYGMLDSSAQSKVMYKGVLLREAVSLGKLPVLSIGRSGRNEYRVSNYVSFEGKPGFIALRIGDRALSSAMKAKIFTWLRETERFDVSKVILLSDEAPLTDHSPFLDDVPVFSWEDVKLKKRAPVSRISTESVCVTYRTPEGAVDWKSTDELEQFLGKKFVHYSPRDDIKKATIDTLVRNVDDVVAVKISAGRHAKLSRITGSVHFKTFLKQELEVLKGEMTETDIIKLNIASHSGIFSQSFVPRVSFDDPEMNNWCEAAESELSTAAVLYGKLGGRLTDDIERESPLNNYHLAKYIGWVRPPEEVLNDLVIYINAAYADRRSKNV